MNPPRRTDSAAGAPDMSRPADGDEWLTVSQAAAILGVGTATVRRWTASGQLRAFVTPGGHRRYRRMDVLALAGTGRPGVTVTADDLRKIWGGGAGVHRG